MNITVKKTVYGGLIIALAILLPQAFHATGVPKTGEIFLPMHIPVLIGGFALGPVFGTLIGVIAPILSHLLTAMPPPVRLPFMIVELGAYGFMSGALYNRLRNKPYGIYLTLIFSMIFGRIAFGIALLIAGNLLNLSALTITLLGESIITGICGMLIQVLFIPPVIYSLEKSGFLQSVNIRR